MPFRPAPGHADPDPRFDPYRERAWRARGSGRAVRLLYLRFDTSWWQLGGHLWWRRWSAPREQVTGYLALNYGGFDDYVEDTDTVVEELEDWQRGLYRYRGLLLTVQWLDDESSLHARTHTFGLDPNH